MLYFVQPVVFSLKEIVSVAPNYQKNLFLLRFNQNLSSSFILLQRSGLKDPYKVLQNVARVTSM